MAYARLRGHRCGSVASAPARKTHRRGRGDYCTTVLLLSVLASVTDWMQHPCGFRGNYYSATLIL